MRDPVDDDNTITTPVTGPETALGADADAPDAGGRG